MIKVLYAGSPEAAALTLNILLQNASENGYEIAGVLTNPPSSKGRHKELIPTPVESLAREHNIPVFTPEHLDGASRDAISPLECNLLISFAYGHIFGPKFLAMFPMGGINLHPSLLPKYRGCTPVPAAILNIDDRTAVTIQKLALKMDEGDILSQEIINLDKTETGDSLLAYSAEHGAKLIVNLLKKASQEGKLPEGTPQSGEASYTGIITKEDGKIDWTDSARNIDGKIRAYTSNPGTWTTWNGETLRILKGSFKEDDNESLSAAPGTVIRFSKPEGIFIKCGSGQICVTELQKQGKKAMNYKDFMNGSQNFPGSQLI